MRSKPTLSIEPYSLSMPQTSTPHECSQKVQPIMGRTQRGRPQNMLQFPHVWSSHLYLFGQQPQFRPAFPRGPQEHGHLNA